MPAPSPNADARPGSVDFLILHYTGMKSAAAAIERLCDPVSKVSAHYVVDEDGTVYQLVDEQQRAWHAGVSFWRGFTQLNDRSIGIEIVNPGHEFGYRAFPLVQMQALAELCQGILRRHDIPARNVIGHSDVAPNRKQDPGELFDWAWLAGQGVGVWPRGSALPGDLPADLAADLAAIGYDMSFPLPVLITAFQRHFLPKHLTGQADQATKSRAAAMRRATTPSPLVGDGRRPINPAVSRARALRQAATPPEQRLWRFLRTLRPEGFHFRRQAPFRVYVLDFVCYTQRLVIEVDGAQHGGEAARAHDAIRDVALAREGFRTLRFAAKDVLSNLEGVSLVIRGHLAAPHPDPPHKGEGAAF